MGEKQFSPDFLTNGSMPLSLSVPARSFEVSVFRRKTETSKGYIVGWVRFFCKATQQGVINVGLRYFAKRNKLTQPTL